MSAPPLSVLLRDWSMQVLIEVCRHDGRLLYSPLADDAQAVWEYFDATAQLLWPELPEEARRRIGERPSDAEPKAQGDGWKAALHQEALDLRALERLVRRYLGERGVIATAVHPLLQVVLSSIDQSRAEYPLPPPPGVDK